MRKFDDKIFYEEPEYELVRFSIRDTVSTSEGTQDDNDEEVDFGENNELEFGQNPAGAKVDNTDF